MTSISGVSDWLTDSGLSFSSPFWVVALCLLLAMLFVVWVWKRNGRRIAVPYDHGSPKTGRGWYALLTSAETLLPFLAGIVMLILCVPLTTGSPIEKRSVTNIQFCVDSSGSMTAQFGDGNRYDASMAAINDFLGYRQGDAFGLTFFASAVVHWCPLTTDSSAFQCAIPFMKPNQQRAIGGGTRIGMALEACREVLNSRDEGDKMIILVSDGQSADLSGGRSEEIAKRLRDSNITVYGIHIGGGDIPEQILTITTATGGDAFLPGDTTAFDEVFRKIDQMKPAKIEIVESEKLDNFIPWTYAALGLLGVWALSLLGLRFTPW